MLHARPSPPSQVLQADLYMALPLALPPALRLKELDVSAARMLIDWGQLCSQVSGLGGEMPGQWMGAGLGHGSPANGAGGRGNVNAQQYFGRKFVQPGARTTYPGGENHRF